MAAVISFFMLYNDQNYVSKWYEAVNNEGGEGNDVQSCVQRADECNSGSGCVGSFWQPRVRVVVD